jgi:hypothetical protein
VACSAEVSTGAGKFRVDALAAKLPTRAWQKLSAGHGAKGHRFYDWAVIDLAATKPGPAPAITSGRPHPRHEDHDLQLEY